MNYILNKKLGFEKDQVMLLQGTQTLGDKLPTLKKQLQQLPSVDAVTVRCVASPCVVLTIRVTSAEGLDRGHPDRGPPFAAEGGRRGAVRFPLLPAQVPVWEKQFRFYLQQKEAR